VKHFVSLYNCGLAAVAVAALCVSPSSRAATIAQWTVEGLTTPADLSNSVAGPPVLATTGTGTLSGLHADAASDWTTPAGPASDNSYSVNTWTAGDYYQFSTSTLGYENIKVSFDSTGSNTGPRDFKIAYSTDGVTYTLLNAAWSSAVSFVNPATAHFDFDFSSIPGLDMAPIASFRLIQAGTVSISGATVAAGGTNRVDNVTISGDLVVPEPCTLALAGLSIIAIGYFCRK
jgi:hypothetical protein